MLLIEFEQIDGGDPVFVSPNYVASVDVYAMWKDGQKVEVTSINMQGGHVHTVVGEIRDVVEKLRGPALTFTGPR